MTDWRLNFEQIFTSIPDDDRLSEQDTESKVV